MDQPPNRKNRRAAGAKEPFDTEAFIRLADRFIGVANTENRKTHATDIHKAFLYGSARYSAFVAKNVLEVPDHEAFVAEMTAAYTEMLRNHLADPEV